MTHAFCRLAIVLSCTAAAMLASADWTVDRGKLKDGAWRTDGLAPGLYYVQATVGENGDMGLRHEGRVVDFTRGSAWRTEGGKPVMTVEAQSAVKAKDCERAIATYEKALRVRPEMLGVYRSLGALYESERDWESALVTYRRSLEAEYNQPDMWEAEKAMLKKLGRAK